MLTSNEAVDVLVGLRTILMAKEISHLKDLFSDFRGRISKISSKAVTKMF